MALYIIICGVALHRIASWIIRDNKLDNGPGYITYLNRFTQAMCLFVIVCGLYELLRGFGMF